VVRARASSPRRRRPPRRRHKLRSCTHSQLWLLVCTAKFLFGKHVCSSVLVFFVLARSLLTVTEKFMTIRGPPRMGGGHIDLPLCNSSPSASCTAASPDFPCSSMFAGSESILDPSAEHQEYPPNYSLHVLIDLAFAGGGRAPSFQSPGVHGQ
jgi:hypothetical protein